MVAVAPVVTLVQAPRHIPSLDGLRAVSFLLVFVAHMGFEDRVPGGLGVTIFFFLSGYLITTLMRSEFERRGYVNLRHFWLRRAWRILPPFYIVLLCAAAIPLLVDPPGTLNWHMLWAQLLHVTNYWVIYRGHQGEPPGTGVYWSLAVEEHFYLLFPWLYIGMQRLKLTPARQAMLLYALCALVLAWRSILVLVFHVATDRTYMGSDTRLDSILFGCALAVWNNPVLDEPRFAPATRRFVLLPVSLAVLIGCLLVRTDVFRETLRYSLQGLALSGVFVAAILESRWWALRWLNWRPLAFVGVLSYSLYLMHYTVLSTVQRFAPPLGRVPLGLLSLALSLALAWLMYEKVEKPCARLRRRLTD